MSKEIRTIQDNDGNVWTGREVDEGTDLFDMVASGLVHLSTGGLTLLASDGCEETTVEVNGEKRHGKVI
jgi:hypothetical protein